MSDMRARNTKEQWQDLRVDDDRRLLVNAENGKITKLYSITGAAAISKATTVATDYPGRNWRLKKLEVTFSTAPTTSENLTVTRTTLGSVPNTRPLTVVFSVDPSAISATSILQIWEDGGIDMRAGDEVTMAYTNTDTRTIKADLEVEVL